MHAVQRELGEGIAGAALRGNSNLNAADLSNYYHQTSVINMRIHTSLLYKLSRVTIEIFSRALGKTSSNFQQNVHVWMRKPLKPFFVETQQWREVKTIEIDCKSDIAGYISFHADSGQIVYQTSNLSRGIRVSTIPVLL